MSGPRPVYSLRPGCRVALAQRHNFLTRAARGRARPQATSFTLAVRVWACDLGRVEAVAVRDRAAARLGLSTCCCNAAKIEVFKRRAIPYTCGGLGDKNTGLASVSL